MKTRSFFYGMLLLALSGSQLAAQNFESFVQRFSGSNAPGYVEPLVTAVGMGLNSGMFGKVDIPASGLSLQLRANAMGIFLSEGKKSFTGSTDGGFNPAQEVETPTVVGASRGTSVSGTGGTEYTFPGGFDIDRVGLIVPSLTVGNLLGTQATLRYVKVEINEEIGSVSLFGLGLRHSIDQYLSNPAVNLSAGFGFQTFEIGDVVSTKQFVLHGEAGKSFGILDLFGGLAYESTSADLEYKYSGDNGEEKVAVSVDGDNTFRFLVGAGLDLGFIGATVDYHIGNLNILNFGVRIGQ